MMIPFAYLSAILSYVETYLGPLLPFVAAPLAMVAFFLPMLAGGIMAGPLLLFGFVRSSCAMLVLSAGVNTMWFYMYFDPFSKQVDQPTLLYGMFGAACVGAIFGCSRVRYR